jgi:hypothetical protein
MTATFAFLLLFITPVAPTVAARERIRAKPGRE